MRKFLTLSAVAAGLFLTASPQAEAVVLTFDDLAPQFGGVTSFDYGGLTFAHDNGIFMAVWDGTSPNSNGTNNLIFSPFSLGSGNMTITKTGGGVFDLLSFDMVISWYNSNPNEVVFVNGSPLNLTQTLTNFAVNLIGVSSVTISNIGVNGSYWSADNFNVNVGVSDVPVPAALPLLAAGLAGLGYAGRRRRKTAH